MHYLPFLRELPFVYLLQGAFTIWMLVDCYRRGAEVFWFWIILMVPGFGSWVYFFVIKIHDFQDWNRSGLGLLQRRPSLESLRYQVSQAPTLANRLLLAERLIGQGDHAEAVAHLEAILPQEPDHCQTLYLLAVCQIELGHPQQAVPLLEKNIARDRRWSNYLAWHLLRKARVESGDLPGAVKTCEQLVKNSPTLEHQCVLAEQLADSGDTGQAQRILEKGLEEYYYAPGQIRRRNRRWASQARRLQKRIAAQTPSDGQ
jgi:hypothetical protein